MYIIFDAVVDVCILFCFCFSVLSLLSNSESELSTIKKQNSSLTKQIEKLKEIQKQEQINFNEQLQQEKQQTQQEQQIQKQLQEQIHNLNQKVIVEAVMFCRLFFPAFDFWLIFCFFVCLNVNSAFRFFCFFIKS